MIKSNIKDDQRRHKTEEYINNKTIYLPPYIDKFAAQKLGENFDYIVSKYKIMNLILDFRDVMHIDARGIGKLLKLYKDLSPFNGKVHLVNINPHLIQKFQSLKIDRIFSIK
jgi:anti-anti-sigma factor